MNLLICGDTVPTAASAPLFACGDVKSLFGSVLGVFAANDHVIVNLECALTDSEGRIRKCGPNLKGPVESAKTLKAAGVTHASLANNHVLDFGVRGLKDTERLLDEAGIIHFGSGDDDASAMQPCFIEQDGKKLAVLTFNEHEYTYALPGQAGAAPFDPFAAMVLVAEAKKQADHVIVIYHGGKEYCEYPSPRLRSACHAMAKLGADAVFCQHSHIIGCMEKVGDSTIVYGQGNFHFVKYLDKPFWNMGLMAQVTIDDCVKVELIPVVGNEHGIDLADVEMTEEILAGFRARSASFADGSWIEGWRAFVEEYKENYINSVKNAYDPGNERGIEVFAHYLDCEAHLDMYHEIYQTWHKTRTDGAMEV